MKTGDIIDEYKTRVKSILKYYDDLEDDFQSDDNHNFRVEIKRLRAFLRLMNLACSGDPQKIPKPFKKFYDRVGDIRNFQLYQQRIEGLCKDLFIKKPDAYLEHLHEEEDLMKKKAGKLKEKISLDDFEKQLTDNASKHLTESGKNDFVRSYHSRLVQLLILPCYFDETFHDIRKLLKDLMYNYEFIEQDICNVMPPLLVELKTMEIFTSVLGDFHDLCLAFYFLSPVNLSEFRFHNETAALAELSNHLNLRKENMKREIIDLLQPVKDQI